MAGLRESTAGRAVLVAIGLALAWGVWNLTLRPYDASFLHRCENAVSVLTSSPTTSTVVPSAPRSRLDKDGDGQVSDFERDLYEARKEVPKATGEPIQFGDSRHEECREALFEVEFWFRALWPLAVIVGGAVTVRYITTGSVRRDSPQHPEKRSMVE